MISFILNDQIIHTEQKPGSTLLDFIRYRAHLTGTKTGCREGDCGACTVLEGRLTDGQIEYRSIISCLTPLGNAAGKHIVTIEGINTAGLNPAQQAITQHGGTQCGFCTPGFVVALTGHTMQRLPSDPGSAIESMGGNICRCTGYKSIERAAIMVSNMLKAKNPDNPIGWLVSQGFLPAYFTSVPEQLKTLIKEPERLPGEKTVIGGGTDLLVQKPDDMADTEPLLLFDRKDLKGIREDNGYCVVGSATTAQEIMQSALMHSYIPRLKSFFFLVSSEPIRNMGTIGGNICNASPIADLVIMFLALNATVLLQNTRTGEHRSVALRKFFLGYKKLDKHQEEIIVSISFLVPDKNTHLNFEKISKRTTLDIASVNSAMGISMLGDTIRHAHISLGGVAPIPLYLDKTSSFLTGRKPEPGTIREAYGLLAEEISPISDIRGSKEYKSLLSRQLFIAHFAQFFPKKFSNGELLKIFDMFSDDCSNLRS